MIKKRGDPNWQVGGRREKAKKQRGRRGNKEKRRGKGNRHQSHPRGMIGAWGLGEGNKLRIRKKGGGRGGDQGKGGTEFI